jgi:hypothetical protein
MKVRINLETAVIIGDYETGKNYSDLIKNSPRKKKKIYKKELARIIIEQIKKSIKDGKLPRD